ncbi:hypothetical protein Tco_0525164 [Tanacetum coccineum]
MSHSLCRCGSCEMSRFKKSNVGKLSFLKIDCLAVIKKQKKHAISTTEAEYITMFDVVLKSLDAIPSKRLRFEFNTIPLYCDNKSAIALCCNNVQHSSLLTH